MIYPTGYPVGLQIRGFSTRSIIQLIGNRERTLMAVLTPNSLSIFGTHPALELVTLVRDEKDIEEKGTNVSIVWKPDSTAICLSTSKNILRMYSVIWRKDVESYQVLESSDPVLRRTSQELFIKDTIPSISLKLSLVVRLASNATSVVPLRDELLVCLKDGFIHRLLWNGTVMEDYSVHITKIPFSNDQLQSKAAYLANESKVYITDASYSPLIGGFSIALSNGKGALLTSPSPKFHPSNLLGVWAPGLDDGVKTVVNHKYRLLTFGCVDGSVTAYHCDEYSGALVQAYRINVTAKDNHEGVANLGRVGSMSWSPYGASLLVSWPNSHVTAMFSAFGAQIWCSADTSLGDEKNKFGACKCVDWGPEGFQAWFGRNTGIFYLNTLRSVGINNPIMEHDTQIHLLGGECLYLSPSRVLEGVAPAPQTAWNQLSLPSDYISNSWPLRYCAMTEDHIVVAGSRGLTYYTTKLRKWRLFGNESQERDMIVSGGLGVWKGHAVAAVYEVEKQTDDFRFYPLHRQLDNLYSTKFPVSAQILTISLKGDVLVTFDVEARVSLYGLSLNSSTEGIVVSRLAEIIVSDIVFHPACLITLHLTTLNHDASAAEFCDGSDTLLLNVAGRLVMLSPSKPNNAGGGGKSSGGGGVSVGGDENKTQQLQQPLLVASYVEQVWHDPYSPIKERGSQLSEALWLQCGAKGMKVWMPLFQSKGAVVPIGSFISKRIMLPFQLPIYPLVISSKDCVGLGVECLLGGRLQSWHINRNSGLFLHHILRQLLKRNLGLYALEIAGSCRSLPYFAHVMELLLHNVLEEETTSSEPIPDPLLPRVVAFVQEFPEFLDTVAHCARKTEQTHWQHLFSTAGNPKDLFEVCIREKRLDTAASFLIVLQNMEPPAASKHHATELLEKSLEEGRWEIGREIVRFLKAIDPEDIDSPPRTPMFIKTQQTQTLPRLSIASPAVADADAFVFQPMGISRRERNSSITEKEPPLPKNSSTKRKDKSPLSKTESLSDSGKKPSPGVVGENGMEVYLNSILRRHARTLLASSRLCDLGHFAAHLDFHLVLWLGRERSRSARIQDFPKALVGLHEDFNWPYPLLSLSVVEHVNKKMASSSIGNKQLSQNNNYLPGFTPQKPLKVITTRASVDSGVRTLDLGIVPPPKKGSGGANAADSGNTKRLLMKQQNERHGGSSPQPNGGTAEDRVASLEAQLARKNTADTALSLAGRTEDSLLTPNSPSLDPETLSNELDWEGLEELCGEAASRGPETSEAQLRFLQQMMLEAACLEWSMLICIILRDFVGLARAINIGSLSQTLPDTLQRLKRGLMAMDDWADQNCLGYKAILSGVSKHLDSLGLKTPESELTSPSMARKAAGKKSSSPSLSSQCAAAVGGGIPPYSPSEMLSSSLRLETERFFADDDSSLLESSGGAGESSRGGRKASSGSNNPNNNKYPEDDHPWNKNLTVDTKDRIHVDIVSPITPNDSQDQSNCVLM